MIREPGINLRGYSDELAYTESSTHSGFVPRMIRLSVEVNGDEPAAGPT